jgi:ATP-dependent DNA helicase RecQ
MSDALFRKGASICEVAEQMCRAPSTVLGYLCDFITRERPVSVLPWVDEPTYQAIAKVASKTAADRLKPIFDALNGRVSYEKIRVVVTHLRTVSKIS